MEVRACLEHVLGDDITLSPDRGVFLHETRRMHPDVCEFISEQIYEGRLTSHSELREAVHRTRHRPPVAESTTMPVVRRSRSKKRQSSPLNSPDYSDTTWVDQHGHTQPLTVDDVMVVAPYNDQVRLLRSHFDSDPVTRGVPAGTVDKFQGREAAIVFFTMTTSSAADMPPRSRVPLLA